jgi:hypothetical protein
MGKVKLNIWQWIKLCILLPFWLGAENPKSWGDFKSSMVPHECEYDYENKITEGRFSHYECKHKGCTIVTMKDKNGDWLNI